MIFGFNTDIKQDESTYHVQSEARVSEQLLQTQVFVQGRCIVKRAVSYAERAQDPAFTEEIMHETLRQQHRWVVEAIRDGYVDDLVKGAEDTPGQDTPKLDEKLELRFVSSARPSSEFIVLNFEVSVNGSAISGAMVRARLAATVDAEHCNSMGNATVSGETGKTGTVELKLPVPPGAHGEANLVVQAAHESLRTLKCFRLKAAPAK